MKTNYATRAACCLGLLPLTLAAQTPIDRDPVTLTNWPAALYWQPSATEAAAKTESGSAARPERNATSPTNSLVFVAVTPCRVVDTRAGSGFTGAFGAPALGGQANRTFPIQSSPNCLVPAIARAYSFNVTVVPPGFLGFVTVYPTGAPLPNASTVNSLQGFIVANAAIVPAGTNGSVDIFANNATDIIIDINGYYAAQDGITLALGTAAAPSLSFAGDPGTGISSSGAGVLNISTGGTNRLSVRADGDLDLSGNIRKGGTLFLHNSGGTNSSNTSLGLSALPIATTGNNNTAVGLGSLNSNATGSFNTAVGRSAMVSNTTGGANAAFGMSAMQSNTTASNNTAMGSFAMANNSTGESNTAMGQVALQFNTTASNNTAIGQLALNANTTGSSNTAIGTSALSANTTVSDNTAVGFSALKANTLGVLNVAVGSQALTANTVGGNNVALGYTALNANTTASFNIAVGVGSQLAATTGGFNVAAGHFTMALNQTGQANTAIGHLALRTTTAGSSNTAIGHDSLFSSVGNNNIALGDHAGFNLTTGDNNVFIGNQSVATESNTIRIGDAQNRAFLAGVRGITTGSANALTVVIDPNGQLGTLSSSRRFKEDIHDMGDVSSGLLRLRPVTYRYRQAYDDGSKPIDYGLIAEEVAEVYPDLVAKTADGQVESVQYHKLMPMLVNELKKVNAENKSLESRLAALESLLASRAH